MKSYLGLLLLSAILCSGLASAQNANDAVRLAFPGLGSSARALGMGNSYVALSDDAGAAFFNPAGLALMKKIEISGGLDYTNYDNNTTFLNGLTSHSTSTTRFNNASFVFPFPTFRGSLVFGLSFNSVNNFTGTMRFDGYNPTSSIIESMVNYDPTTAYNLYLSDANNNPLLTGDVQQSGDVLKSGSLHNWSFSGAIEVYKNIYVGANLNFITGGYESSNDYFEDDVNNIYRGRIDPNDPNSPSDFVYLEENKFLDWDISGFDAKIGMIYQFVPQARFGMTIQFPKYYNIEEHFSYSAASYFNVANDSGFSIFGYDYADQVEYDVITPFTFSAGFSGNLKGLIVSAEATVIDYTQTEFDEPYGIDPSYLAGVNKDIKDLLRTVVNYNFGLEYTIPMTGLRLRGGYFVHVSPYEGDDPKYDHKYFTGGLGFLVDDAVAFDLGYAHGWWEDFGENYGVNVSRTYQDITTDTVIFTAAFRF